MIRILMQLCAAINCTPAPKFSFLLDKLPYSLGKEYLRGSYVVCIPHKGFPTLEDFSERSSLFHSHSIHERSVYDFDRLIWIREFALLELMQRCRYVLVLVIKAGRTYYSFLMFHNGGYPEAIQSRFPGIMDLILEIASDPIASIYLKQRLLLFRLSTPGYLFTLLTHIAGFIYLDIETVCMEEALCHSELAEKNIIPGCVAFTCYRSMNIYSIRDVFIGEGGTSLSRPDIRAILLTFQTVMLSFVSYFSRKAAIYRSSCCLWRVMNVAKTQDFKSRVRHYKSVLNSQIYPLLFVPIRKKEALRKYLNVSYDNFCDIIESDERVPPKEVKNGGVTEANTTKPEGADIDKPNS